MSYLALQNAWTSAVQPPVGILGTGLNGTMTTQQKITAINGWVVSATIPSTIEVTGTQLLNCINYPEFAAIATTSLQANLLALCNNPGLLIGGTANTTHIAAGLFLAAFTTGSQTIAALAALAQAQLWWATPVANGGAGLSAPVSPQDLIAAGGLT